MARPKKKRIVNVAVDNRSFSPHNKSVLSMDLKMDELEAMRLCDGEELFQEKAAGKMGVSRRTLERILYSGRKKVADALVLGKEIQITLPEYVSFKKGVKNEFCSN
ncbi:MAG: DUF134 domain-containing protein [Candidatus Saganbacteria bacterium]|nr:DUF134 domain-containing protein [Candidatus Saganbacteria bacterium]